MSSLRDRNRNRNQNQNLSVYESNLPPPTPVSYTFLNKIHNQFVDTAGFGASYLDKFNETLQSRDVYQEVGNEFDPICREHLDYIRQLSKRDYDRLSNFAEIYVKADYKYRKTMLISFFHNWRKK